MQKNEFVYFFLFTSCRVLMGPAAGRTPEEPGMPQSLVVGAIGRAAFGPEMQHLSCLEVQIKL